MRFRNIRAQPLPHWRRASGDRIPQRRASIPVHLPPQRRPQHRQRQNERGGSPPQHRCRRQEPSRAPPRAPRRVHQLRRHVLYPWPLRHLLGDQEHDRTAPRAANIRRGGGGVLHRSGGGAGLRVSQVQDQR